MLENGKGSGGMGRNAYRSDRRDSWERGGNGRERNSYGDRNGDRDRGGYPEKGAFINPAVKGPASKNSEQGAGASPLANQSPQAQMADIEKRLTGISQDFTQAVRKMSEKENEKFDLIFAILSELQGRQAQLEETVRSLNAQLGNGQMNGQQASSNATGSTMPQNAQVPQQGQFAGSGSQQQQQQPQQSQPSYQQMGGQMNGQMNNAGGMAGQQTMQQYSGVMQPDGSQAMYPMQHQMQQVLVVQSPQGGGMQYAMPQMMSPTGVMQNTMQPMQMQAMQYIPQSPNGNQDMSGGFVAAAPGPGTPSGQEAHNGGIPAEGADGPSNGCGGAGGQPQNGGQPKPATPGGSRRSSEGGGPHKSASD